MTNKELARYYRHIRRHLLRQSDICALCGNRIVLMRDATIDHIVPLSRGGSSLPHNLQVAHAACNREKGNRMPEDLRSDSAAGQ